MKIFLTIFSCVLGSIIFFSIGFAILNGDLTPYFLNTILCGVIIGILVSIYNKMNRLEKKINDLEKK